MKTLILLLLSAFPAFGSTLSYSVGEYSRASAEYGHVSASIFGPGYFVSAYAVAGFEDLLTISGGTGNATLDYLVNYQVFSQQGGNEGAGSTYCFNTASCPEGEYQPDPYKGVFSEALNFTFGMPFHSAFGVKASGYDAPGGSGGTPQASASLDIQSLTVVCCSCGSNLTFSDASGTIYPFASNVAFVQTPELPTWVLILAGVISSLDSETV